MNDARPDAVVRLEGELVQVTGEGLDSSRHSLFFGAVLGCHRAGEAWICPTRGQPGSDLVVRIATELNRRAGRLSTLLEAVPRRFGFDFGTHMTAGGTG